MSLAIMTNKFHPPISCASCLSQGMTLRRLSPSNYGPPCPSVAPPSRSSLSINPVIATASTRPGRTLRHTYLQHNVFSASPSRSIPELFQAHQGPSIVPSHYCQRCNSMFYHVNLCVSAPLCNTHSRYAQRRPLCLYQWLYVCSYLVYYVAVRSISPL